MQWYYWTAIGIIILILFMLFEWFRNLIVNIIVGIYNLAKRIIIGVIIVVLGLWLAYWLFIKYLI
jgi:hypothetical protein